MRDVSVVRVVDGPGIEVEQQTVTIEANADAEQVVKELPAGAAKVTVTVQSDDALQADNSASLVLARESKPARI